MNISDISGPVLDLVKNNRVIVTLGSGGVGKTTTSVALAVLGAMLGKKVGLLSIDPAKRLADAMGIKLGSSLSKVEFAADSGVTGSVYGAMLDQKAVFDEMVEKWAPSQKVKDKIYANSIYKEVSANLGGPLEYMALAKLQSMSEDKSFDLIVLDTPPDTHALDFLQRPDALSGFTDGGVMTWLIKPFYMAQKLGAGKLLKASGRLMSGISNVTGVKMLQLLSEFLVLMEDVIKGFAVAGNQVSELLKSSDTSFILVAAPNNAAVRSAECLLDELGRNQFPLGGLFVNRCLASDLEQSLAHFEHDPKAGNTPGVNLLLKKRDHGKDLLAKLKSHMERTFGDRTPMIKVEEHKQFIHSLESLLSFSHAVAGAAKI
ncbi:ArsA family ATPase [Pseudobacteriovorax antillogorgiicola]|uniref:arsenite-transporting ATPase n=1 Tax=Pseudobacteriovorax antillogorgiicola TaxID=1513793 RepID=A0A1Y6BNL7_9BACT|nr:ArsA-related P-loop ATPase [Pseudobacteriovorax antillogorgiicola]TCS53871.1 arsenite efflux ATP-binding protein ArsA [Pseudobacteriovorax antillogorgiicola]SMF21308.1 arsenite efflux ATP-binding protein ArsA [Pseudobacteriovorax antillogorgiicola]